MFIRTCPKCKKMLHHTNKYNRDLARKLKRYCRSCIGKALIGIRNPMFGKKHTEEAKNKMSTNSNRASCQTDAFRKKMSKVTSGNKNPMFGRTHYDIWIEKYGKEEADKRDAKYREKQSKICSGEGNPMFGKPAPQGSGNGWSGWYKDWYFRSLRELSYLINHIEKSGLSWKSAESAGIKIPYLDWKKTQRNYVADFLVNDKILIEVKPEKLKSSPSVKAKQFAAEEFCKQRGWEYKIEDCKPIQTKLIKKLRKEGVLKFIDRYEKKFKEKFDGQ